MMNATERAVTWLAGITSPPNNSLVEIFSMNATEWNVTGLLGLPLSWGPPPQKKTFTIKDEYLTFILIIAFFALIALEYYLVNCYLQRQLRGNLSSRCSLKFKLATIEEEQKEHFTEHAARENVPNYSKLGKIIS